MPSIFCCAICPNGSDVSSGKYETDLCNLHKRKRAVTALSERKIHLKKTKHVFGEMISCHNGGVNHEFFEYYKASLYIS